MIEYPVTMITAAQLIDNAMELSLADRSYIASKLIESLEDERELSPAWQEEIRERVARRDMGKSQTISQESLHDEIESILNR